jgi:hypothetical protein
MDQTNFYLIIFLNSAHRLNPPVEGSESLHANKQIPISFSKEKQVALQFSLFGC